MVTICKYIVWDH